VDREEFTSFYAASFPRLVGQLYAMTGDRAEAQDAVQEAFVRAWAVITFTPDGKTVYVVASNEVVPVNTATNQPGQPIRVPYGMPGGAVITP
jgi:hypothetical protein